jgi:hypothetical protein
VLLAEGWADTVAALKADAKTWLMANGVPEFDIDSRFMTGPRFEHVSWSDTTDGMVHDCADHGPEDYDPEVCMADQRHVTLVCDLPPTWL